MRAFACVVALVAAAAGIWAQEGGQSAGTATDAGQIEVKAESYSPIVLQPAGSVTVIDADDIAKSGETSAADALVSTAGIWISRYGPNGSASSASVAGASSNQMLVIVDGQRLNDARQGGADLSLIPAESIEKIEVLRGGASAAYGADAMGGVIVITTKKSGKPHLGLRVDNTSFPTALAKGGARCLIDSQSLGLDAGARLGVADIAVSAQAERADNRYAYDDGGATKIRDNAGFWNGAGNLSVSAPFASGRVSALAAGSYQSADQPGSLSWPLDSATQKNSAARGSLGWSSDALADGALSLDTMIHGSFSRLAYANPSTSEHDRHDMKSGGLDARGVASLASWADLGFGASLLYEAADSTAFETNEDGQPDRLTIGGYIEPELRFGEKLKLKPALRYDWSEDYTAGVSVMLNAVYAVNQAVDLRLSGGRSYRAPTFNELYWPYSNSYGYITGGNPDLKPEVAWSGEFGTDIRIDAFKVSAALSARYVEDLIVDPYASSYNYIPYNLDSAFMPDATLEASYRVGPATLKARYEFLYPLDLSDGKTISDNDVIEGYARHQAGCSADFNFGSFSAGASLSYWSERSSSSYALPGLALVDLNAAYKATKNLGFTLAVKNLFNADYQLVYGYPMPGTSLKVGARLDI